MSRGVRVKICGVRRAEDAAEAASAGADMVGLNFYARSPRSVDVETARAISAALPPHVWRVGVFVNASREEVERVREGVGLDAIQLHGDEPAEMLSGWGCKVIRALRLTSPDDARRALAAFAPDLFLCEGDAGEKYGGGGATFDWDWAQEMPRDRLILAGGLTPENVRDAVRALRPFAIDVASGVEISPGVKDAARMAALIENAKAA